MNYPSLMLAAGLAFGLAGAGHAASHSEKKMDEAQTGAQTGAAQTDGASGTMTDGAGTAAGDSASTSGTGATGTATSGDGAATTGAGDSHSAAGSEKWGPDDTLGSFNYVTPEVTQQAMSLVKQGKTHGLGIVTGRATPAFAPRSYEMMIVQPGQQNGKTLGANKLTYNDDVLITWMGIGSQIDGLGHIGVEGVYYNDNKVEDFGGPTGLTVFGIEKVPPIATRGVVLDIAKLRGVETMEEGDAITAEDIQAAEEAQGVEIREGDVVLLNTGWMNIIESDPQRFGTVEPGLGMSGAEYLLSKNVAAVGSDSWALEVLPSEDSTVAFPVHELLIQKNGTYILENMDTGPLAKEGISEFLFVLGAPRFEGAVQAIINPVALY